MVKTRSRSLSELTAEKRNLEIFTIKGNDKIIRVKDTVLMKPSKKNKDPYVAHVETFEADAEGNVNVTFRWFYRPEDTIGGRRQFHGMKELFLTERYDTQNANTILDQCTVHNYKTYTSLDAVSPNDFFCRFEYQHTTGMFTPDDVMVYCKCNMPSNPDDLMLRCEACQDWFHPACINMTIEQAMQLDKFTCDDCSRCLNLKFRSSQ